MCRSLQVKVTQPQAHTPPNVCPASRHSKATQPMEGFVRRGRVRLVKVGTKPSVVVPAASQPGVDGARLPQDLVGAAPIIELQYWLVLREIHGPLRSARPPP